MKIAVYHNLPSGGAKRTLQELTRRLAVGHTIDVYSLSGADHAFADLRPWAAAHHVAPFKPLPLLRSPFGRLNQGIRCLDLARLDTVARQVARRIDEGRYDAVFVHPCMYEQAPTVLRYLASTPSVYYCHESNRLLYQAMPPRPHDDAAIGRRRLLNAVDPLPRIYRRQLQRIDQRNLRSADTVLVNSRFTAAAVARIYAVTPEVSYHGVDTSRFRPVPVQKRHMVLSVGSLTRLKGFDFLVESMAQYPVKDRPTLLIASNFEDPLERTYIDQLARERNVNLSIVGSVSDDDLLRLYNEALVVAYAPVREPFGLVPLEAMACGTPVVAVAEGGIPESVVDGETGLLTDRDPTRFAAALARVVTDQALARRLGERGRGHVATQWTWDRATARVEGHLASALDNARGGRARPAGAGRRLRSA